MSAADAFTARYLGTFVDADGSERTRAGLFRSVYDRIDLRPYHRRIWRARVIAAGPRVLRIPCRTADQWRITHRSAVRPGWWQASWFDADGPFGHSEHADWAALVRHVDTSGFGPRWEEVTTCDSR